MKLYIKQKVFSWGDKFNIYDQNQRTVYSVRGEILSIGKKLHIYNERNEEIAFIHQKVMSFLPRYFVDINGRDVACVRKDFSFLKPKYTVEGTDWTVNGSFGGHDYRIENGMGTVAAVSKQWLSWGDTYEIDIFNETDSLLALCTVLVIDAVMAAESSSAS